jgi:hypothetical protein
MSRAHRTWMAIAIVAAAVAWAGVPAAEAASASVPARGLGPLQAVRDVAAISPSDVWAVGNARSRPTAEVRYRTTTLATHWDGHAWTAATTPNVGRSMNVLSAVSAESTRDIWSVGYLCAQRGAPDMPLIEHFDGSDWTVSDLPLDPAVTGSLTDVEAISPTDVWAVGSGNRGGLLAHFDGTSWSPVDVPGPFTYDLELDSVTSTSSTDVWVVGETDRPKRGSVPFTMHFDGATWTVVPAPKPKLGDRSYFVPLQAVSAVSPTDVWAVGRYAFPGSMRGYIEHWDGHRWHLAPFTRPANDSQLFGVSMVSATEGWAVGGASDVPGTSTRFVIEHWDGSTWSRVPIEGHVTDAQQPLLGVSADSGADAWTVGGGRGGAAFLEHWDGSTWSRT